MLQRDGPVGAWDDVARVIGRCELTVLLAQGGGDEQLVRGTLDAVAQTFRPVLSSGFRHKLPVRRLRGRRRLVLNG
jgi:hypothetical protein